MKRTWLLIGVMVLATATAWSQGSPLAAAAAKKDGGTVPMGLGATFIDGQAYYLINLAPEVSFGNLGVGLDLNLRIGTNGKIRSEDFDEGYDYLRIIRYVRWGQKKEPLYIRVGQLDYSRLGHGFILYNYKNSPSYDLRKVGLELDVNFETFGLETMYSDFARAGVFGARGYVRPLKFTAWSKIPVVNNLETGVTFAMDVDKNANREFDPLTGTAKDNGSLAIIGMDVGLPIISYKIFKTSLYFDYATILDYGAGAAAGVDLHFSGLGLVTLSAKYERRWLGDQFLPSYFNSLYEQDRFIPLDSVAFTSKAMTLRSAKAIEGYYGEVMLSVLNTLHIIGGYQAPVGVRNAGLLHLQLLTGDIIPVLQFSAGYDKRNVGSVFKVDNNSVLHAEVGYKPYPFMVVSMLYQWTFRERKDAQDRVVGYEPQRRVEPKVSFVFNF